MLSSTTPGCSDARAGAPAHVAFRRLNGVGAWDRVSFAAQGWPARSPADPSQTSSRMLRTARGRCGSLHLHRNGLAPSTPCRSPGALKLLLPPRQSRGVSR